MISLDIDIKCVVLFEKFLFTLGEICLSAEIQVFSSQSQNQKTW